MFARIREHAPCYCYDSAVIKENCRRLSSALKQVTFLYSLKANPFEPLVRFIRNQGMGADAAAVKEVLEAESVGIGREQIFYSAPGKTKQDIEAVYGKCVIVADSIHELELLNHAAAERGDVLAVGIRVNPRTAFSDLEASSKFGIDEEQISEGLLSGFDMLKISGIHIHVRSQILDAEMLTSYYEHCYDTAVRISQHSSADIRFINFGSGIGMVYDAETQKAVDLYRLAQVFEQLQKKNTASLNAVFYLETGRFIVGNAGKYYTPVVDIKVSRGKKYLIVKNGANGFFRPAIAQLLRNVSGSYPKAGMEPFYTCENETQVRVIGDCDEMELVTVVGNLCTAQDIVCADALLNKAKIGDLIELSNAGSYGYSLSPLLFAGHDLPEQFLV